MPWIVQKTGEEWCVYKEGPSGNAVGDALGCHESESSAKKQVKALYANVKEFGDSLGDFIDRARSQFSKTFRPSYAMDGDSYTYVADVFPEYVVVRQGDKYFHVGMAVDSEKIVFDEQKDWKPVTLSYVTETLQENVRDVMVVWEFKGKYPEVPFAEGVDTKSLTEGDEDPVFLTLPIGKADVVSGNKRYYDSSFVAELEKQVVEHKPVGLMGHLSEAARATEFPNEAVHWVGAKLDGGLLWGKGYVPPGDARKRIKRYRASGKKIATSIDAYIKGTWDKDLNAYRMDAKTMRLNQIDIAPADRAGVADLAAVPYLTKEMSSGYVQQEPDVEQEEFDSMDRLEIIREMTAEDIRLLPKVVRDAVLASAEAPAEVEIVQKVRELVGIPADQDVLGFFKAWQASEQERQQQRVKNRLQELISDPEKGIKLEAARPLVRELVELRNPLSVEAVDAAYDTVVALPSVQEMLKLVVTTSMGPKLNSQVSAQADSSKYFPIPEAA